MDEQRCRQDTDREKPAVDAAVVEVCPAAGRCSEAAVVVAGNTDTHHCAPFTLTTFSISTDDHLCTNNSKQSI